MCRVAVTTLSPTGMGRTPPLWENTTDSLQFLHQNALNSAVRLLGEACWFLGAVQLQLRIYTGCHPPSWGTSSVMLPSGKGCCSCSRLPCQDVALHCGSAGPISLHTGCGPHGSCPITASGPAPWSCAWGGVGDGPRCLGPLSLEWETQQEFQAPAGFTLVQPWLWRPGGRVNQRGEVFSLSCLLSDSILPSRWID